MDGWVIFPGWKISPSPAHLPSMFQWGVQVIRPLEITGLDQTAGLQTFRDCILNPRGDGRSSGPAYPSGKNSALVVQSS